MSEQAETGCRKSPDGLHCEHWYDDEAPCCRCADDGDHDHGDHHPALDCRVCWERIDDGRTTLEQVYELEGRRRRNGAALYSMWKADRPPISYEDVAWAGKDEPMEDDT